MVWFKRLWALFGQNSKKWKSLTFKAFAKTSIKKNLRNLKSNYQRYRGFRKVLDNKATESLLIYNYMLVLYISK